MSLQERTPVPILQHDAEFETLLWLYRKLEPRRVLEIGTYHGGTLYHWLQHAHEEALIVSVDTYAAGVDNRGLYESWKPEHTDIELQVIEGDSRDPAIISAVDKCAGGQPFDWVFIDAGHYYQEVKSDWDTYAGLASGDSVIALHDILEHPAHPEIEVARLWREIRQDDDVPPYLTFEIIADPFAEWGGIGVVLL